MTEAARTGLEIAVIGLAGRFPGAPDIAAFWRNLQQGVESISFFSDEDVLAAGVDEALVANPLYVKARGILGDVDRFDATFFGYSPKEAAMIDPQHRLFLEVAWQALEDAGYNARRYPGRIGVYASVGFNSYLMLHMEVAPDFIKAEQGPQAMLGNDKDFLASRVSYKLGLTGPSVVVQSACSSSLVAIHQACQSLLSGEADMQLAGGVTIRVPEQTGSLYQEGMINSPDGHTRPFDKDAAGTVAGNGVAVVVLKRLEDAIAEGDHIYAVIKASAVNNDGDDKVGYSAPSAGGQVKVIEAALALAEVPVETIGLIEGHGSGTKLGDPIEIKALRTVFARRTNARHFCAVGSVKANVGHLDAAAGVAGFMKAVLALYHKQIPPSINFTEPNPLCEFEESPFFVNSERLDWRTNGHPRRAGVSSFGMGGTNAHLILEEAPPRTPSGDARPWQLLCLSAKNAKALDRLKDQLRADLAAKADTPLADIAYTLHVGRHTFTHNFFALSRTTHEAREKMTMGHNEQCFSTVWDGTERSVVFMFSGQGSQYVNMARALYEAEPGFRAAVDRCAEIVSRHLGEPLLPLMFPAPGAEEATTARLAQTAITQPALFTIEYALAQLLMRWGVKPEALIGHSIGEYVAACLAGVFSLEDALFLVAHRGRLMQKLPTGVMLLIPQPEEEVVSWLNETVALATVNAPSVCVVSGEAQAMAELQAKLDARGVRSRVLRTSHAFHSHMMEPILEEFKALFAHVTLRPPRIPVASNVTGGWMTEGQAGDPAYWAAQLRQTVKFAKGVEKIAKGPFRIFLEVGPGTGLSQFARQTLGRQSNHLVESTLPKADEQQDALFTVLRAVGKLWSQGAPVDWTSFYANERRQRTPLGVYPFRGNSYWVNFDNGGRREPEPGKTDIFWSPLWMKQPTSQGQAVERAQAMVLHPGTAWQRRLLADVTNAFERTVWVESGHKFAVFKADHYRVRFGSETEYAKVFTDAHLDGQKPLDVFFFYPEKAGKVFGLSQWLLPFAPVSSFTSSSMPPKPATKASIGLSRFTGFLRALAGCASTFKAPIRLTVMSSTTFEVTGGEEESWERQLVCKFLQAMQHLMPTLTWRFIDLGQSTNGAFLRIAPLLDEDLGGFRDRQIIAYRSGQRWLRTLTPYAIRDQPEQLRIAHYLVFAEINDFTCAFVKAWSARHGGSYIVACAQEMAPREDWPAQEEPVYQHLLALHQAGVEVDTVRYAPGDAKTIRQTVKRLRRTGLVAALNVTPTLHGEIPDILLHVGAQHIAAVVRQLQRHMQALSSAPLASCTWISFQPSMLGRPDCWINLCRDGYLQTTAKKHGHALVYLNEDFFANDFAKDWLQRVDVTERMAACQKAINQARATDFVWLSARPADAFPWKFASAKAEATPADEPRLTGDRYERPDLSTPYAAPLTERQKIICAIWQEMFHIDQVGIHDNFFDLGGDSVMALKLLAALETHFKVALPLSEVINAPTVADQANSIVEYSTVVLDQRKLSPRVALQSGGHNPPFFCVHPAGGVIHCYIAMSRLLGKDQPFYAFQHPGIDGKSGPYTTYEKMAELYINAMREVQPQGPYFLGGWSFGGTVAYEMASQLTAQGQHVAMLALFDSPGPSALYRLSERPAFEFAGMLAFLSQALGSMFGGEIQVSVEEMRKIKPEAQLRYVLDRLVQVSGEQELDNAKAALERIVEIFEVCDKGERDYAPKPYPHDIYMYRVQELADYEFTGYKDHPQLTSAAFGWDELCKSRVIVRFVPGTHISMIFQPNVQVLTEKFQADLRHCITAARDMSAGSSNG